MQAALAVPSFLAFGLVAFVAGQATSDKPADLKVARLSIVDDQGHVRAELGMSPASGMRQPQFRLLDESGRERLVLELAEGGSDISLWHSDGSMRAWFASYNGRSELSLGAPGLAKVDAGLPTERPLVEGGFVQLSSGGEGVAAKGYVSVRNAKGKATYLNPEGVDAWPGK